MDTPRATRLRKLGFYSYDAYLRSKRWKRRKHEYGKRHARKCSECGTTDNIHLHHLTYEWIGEERDEDLCWLCEPHHAEIHKREAKQPRQKETLVERHLPAARRDPFEQARREEAKRKWEQRKNEMLDAKDEHPRKAVSHHPWEWEARRMATARDAARIAATRRPPRSDADTAKATTAQPAQAGVKRESVAMASHGESPRGDRVNHIPEGEGRSSYV